MSNKDKLNRDARIQRAKEKLGNFLNGKIIPHEHIVTLLEQVIESKDRVCIEGDNQKQADFLASALTLLDPEKIHDLHMVQSVVSLPAHLDIFEKGIASRLDFSYSAPQGLRLAKLIANNKIQIGAIHTYLELYSRFFMDLNPKICLIAAESADRNGNLYTGANTEETPVIVEATAFKNGIVIAQVNKIVDEIPRIDITSDWVDFIVEAPTPNYIEPLFTRNPASITEVQILMAMMVIKGIYLEYGVQKLNHGIGFNTAAIELLLPTYGKSLGLKGKIATHWALNPHPTIIPAIEDGLIESIYCFGSEVGMEDYVSEHSDIFFIGKDGSMRSNRSFCQMAGLYACDLFIGSTLQIDLDGNSSTAIHGRITGFGGAPNMGSDPHGRRHTTAAYLKAGRQAYDKGNMRQGKKLVVQIVETFGSHMRPSFVDTLDAFEVAKQSGMELPPVMIYGDDVTHIVTEEGIANLLLCRSKDEREQAIRGVAGYTAIGRQRDHKKVKALRERGIILLPEDLGIDPREANRDLLAAKNMKDLVKASKGLYKPPKNFRDW